MGNTGRKVLKNPIVKQTLTWVAILGTIFSPQAKQAKLDVWVKIGRELVQIEKIAKKREPKIQGERGKRPGGSKNPDPPEPPNTNETEILPDDFEVPPTRKVEQLPEHDLPPSDQPEVDIPFEPKQPKVEPIEPINPDEQRPKRQPPDDDPHTGGRPSQR
jgi:hypothetical protein